MILEKHGVANAKRWEREPDTEVCVNVVDRDDFVGLSAGDGCFMTADQAEMVADYLMASARRLRHRQTEEQA